MVCVALGATDENGGCQTLGQVSKQMDSLLDRQSCQRILPNEPRCLLAKGAEFTVIGGSQPGKNTSKWRELLYSTSTQTVPLLTHHIWNDVLAEHILEALATTPLSTTALSFQEKLTLQGIMFSLTNCILYLEFMSIYHFTLMATHVPLPLTQDRGVSLCSTWAHRRGFPRKAC